MIGAGRNKLSKLLLQQLQTMSMQSVKMELDVEKMGALLWL